MHPETLTLGGSQDLEKRPFTGHATRGRAGSRERRVAREGVPTYPVFMNVTLSLEDEVVEEARKVAAGMGTSLNQLIRDYLRQLTSRHEVERDLAELRALSLESHGDSRGWRFDRDELHERS